MRYCVPLLGLVLPGLLLAAAWQAPAEQAAPDEIARLVRQLGHDDFAEREAASKRIDAIGEPALEALRKAAASEDPEVRRRARDLVRAIERRLSGEQLCLYGHTDVVVALAVSRAGDRLLTGSHDDTIRLWDLTEGKELRRLDLEGFPTTPSGVALSPDGKRAVSCGVRGWLALFDVATGKVVRHFENQRQDVREVAFTPDGKRVVSAGCAFVRLWDVETGKKLGSCEGHTDCITSVVCAPDGKRVATGSSDRTIRVWDLETGKEVRKLAGHTDVVLGVAFSPAGKTLVSGSWDGTVRLWDVESGKELRRFTESRRYVLGVAFSPDGKRIASGHNRLVLLWDVATGKKLRAFEGHTGDVYAVAFLPDGRRLVSCGEDATVRVWLAPR